MNRNEDLTKVFDRTWKANHNDDVKIAKEREKKFMNKMFNIKEDNTLNNNINNTPSSSASTLQNSYSSFQRQNTVNNLKKNWK